VHRPVLLQESIEALAIKTDGFYIDGTFGRGGHSEAILAKLGKEGTLFVIDKDPQAVDFGKKRFSQDARFSIVHSSFHELKNLVSQYFPGKKADGILLDLGVSSPQLDEAERGFSFMKDGPLDMRMDPTTGISAETWLKQVSEKKLIEVLKTDGEERFAKRIAHAIVEARKTGPINRTGQLAEIVKTANPAWERHKHPATRTFQAIRIFINRELEDLSLGLNQCLDVLAPGGRLAVISFHSLEDRIVKRFLRKYSQGDLPMGLPVTKDQLHVRMRLVSRAIKPQESEVLLNPRARSAILRVGELLQ
jgi:16S rRNA (cytosine1402-N4)-methyltransferase